MKKEEEQNPEKSYLKSIFIGIILGLSFVPRFQIGLLIGGYLLWLLFIKKEISG
jgi:hypothetical protein